MIPIPYDLAKKKKKEKTNMKSQVSGDYLSLNLRKKN